nr:MAG TPA: Morphogenesis protein 1 wall, phi29, hydrolase, infection [Caudoviricetes sp.]
MGWISRPSGLNQQEMENNANIVINTYRSMGFNDMTIAGILGNMQNESSINPEREEVGGGGGYGLVQWTPQSVLFNHCNTLGYSPYNDGDVQLKVIEAELLGNPSSVNEWYTSQAFIDNFKPSGATDDMVGITGEQFKTNEMNWKPDKLALMFMVGYERPSYDPDVNHIEKRKKDALWWFEYMGGVIPPDPPPSGNGKSLINLWLCKALTGGL